MTRATWKTVKPLLKMGLYLSHDDVGNTVMRCNNGWIQARTPTQAMAFLRSIVR